MFSQESFLPKIKLSPTQILSIPKVVKRESVIDFNEFWWKFCIFSNLSIEDLHSVFKKLIWWKKVNPEYEIILKYQLIKPDQKSWQLIHLFLWNLHSFTQIGKWNRNSFEIQLILKNFSILINNRKFSTNRNIFIV